MYTIFVKAARMASCKLLSCSERYRLVIAEYEEYIVEDDRQYDKVPEKKDRRLVFVEHVEMD
jgi:hypothetical protein